MSNIVVKKWIEPYVLLETLKKHYQMKDFTFDGWTKNDVKADFYKALKQPQTLGLYMKNVNKFYVFFDALKFNAQDMFEFESGDCETAADADSAISLVDMAKAEAVFIKF